MILGICGFVLVMIMIAPKSQAFVLNSVMAAGAWIMAWAPLSFFLLALLLMAPLVGIYLMKTWPVHVEPENPMAKYRREPVDTDEF